MLTCGRLLLPPSYSVLKVLCYNPPMGRVPRNIGEFVPEDARKGALEAAARMAEHPGDWDAAKGNIADCSRAYLRERKTGKVPGDAPANYRAMRKYVAEIVRGEESIRAERSRRWWETFRRASEVVVFLGALAAIAQLALTLSGL